MMMIVVEDRRGVVLISIVVSVLLHVAVGAVLLMVKLPGFGDDSKMMGVEEVVEPLEREDELRLGLTEAKSASINWLGINEPEPVVGEAVISETEQAAQAIVVGRGDEMAQENSVDELVDELVREPVEPVDLVEPVEMIEPVEMAIEDLVEELIDELVEDSVVVVVEQDQRVETGEKSAEQTAMPSQEPVEAVVERVVKKKPMPSGTVGVLSKREAIATRIKRALEVDPHKPNAPVVGKGLEIKTVHPRYPTAVRLSALPKNPVVVILFDAKGKVSKAEFLRDGRKVYSSGTPGVDQPLLNSIYQWRAKGKQIDALDVDDPKSLVEVTIKIVYQKERKRSSD